MVGFLLFTLEGHAMRRMLNQTLAHKPAEIRQSVGNFGGVFVKADGFVLPHVSSDEVALYVCMYMYVVQ